MPPCGCAPAAMVDFYWSEGSFGSTFWVTCQCSNAMKHLHTSAQKSSINFIVQKSWCSWSIWPVHTPGEHQSSPSKIILQNCDLIPPCITFKILVHLLISLFCWFLFKDQWSLAMSKNQFWRPGSITLPPRGIPKWPAHRFVLIINLTIDWGVVSRLSSILSGIKQLGADALIHRGHRCVPTESPEHYTILCSFGLVSRKGIYFGWHSTMNYIPLQTIGSTKGNPNPHPRFIKEGARLNYSREYLNSNETKISNTSFTRELAV